MTAARRGKGDGLEADIAFHLAILDQSGNRLLMRLKPLVEAALRISIRFTVSIARNEDDKADDHRRVLDAIEARGSEGAARAMRALVPDALALMQSEDTAAHIPSF